jgi:DNA repair ATPase RecN
MVQASAARETAFVAEGQAKASRQDAADAAARQAGVASAQAEKHQVQIDLLQRRLEVVNAQLQTLATQSDNLKQQAEQVRQFQSASAGHLAQLQQTRRVQAEALRTEYDQLAGVYQSSVAGQYAAAAGLADDAVALLANVGGAELLGALVSQAHVNSQHAATAATWAGTMNLLATVSEAAALDGAGEYRAVFEQVDAEHQQAATAAGEALTAARELAATLGDSPEVTRQTQLLDQYEQRLAR